MKPKISDKKIRSEKIEERVKFFMNKQTTNNSSNSLKKNKS